MFQRPLLLTANGSNDAHLGLTHENPTRLLEERDQDLHPHWRPISRLARLSRECAPDMDSLRRRFESGISLLIMILWELDSGSEFPPDPSRRNGARGEPIYATCMDKIWRVPFPANPLGTGVHPGICGGSLGSRARNQSDVKYSQSLYNVQYNTL